MRRDTDCKTEDGATLKGGHLAAHEQPTPFVGEARNCFGKVRLGLRSVRQ